MNVHNVYFKRSYFAIINSQYFKCLQCLFQMLGENTVYQKTGQSKRIIIYFLNDVLNNTSWTIRWKCNLSGIIKTAGRKRKTQSAYSDDDGYRIANNPKDHGLSQAVKIFKNKYPTINESTAQTFVEKYDQNVKFVKACGRSKASFAKASFLIMVAWSEDTKQYKATQFKQWIFENQSKPNKQLTKIYLQIRTYITATIPSTPKSEKTRSTSKQQENLTSHCHSMMTKKLKLGTRCPLKLRYKECIANWFYCEKPSQNKTLKEN